MLHLSLTCFLHWLRVPHIYFVQVYTLLCNTQFRSKLVLSFSSFQFCCIIWLFEVTKSERVMSTLGMLSRQWSCIMNLYILNQLDAQFDMRKTLQIHVFPHGWHLSYHDTLQSGSSLKASCRCTRRKNVSCDKNPQPWPSFWCSHSRSPDLKPNPVKSACLVFLSVW